MAYLRYLIRQFRFHSASPIQANISAIQWERKALRLSCAFCFQWYRHFQDAPTELPVDQIDTLLDDLDEEFRNAPNINITLEEFSRLLDNILFKPQARNQGTKEVYHKILLDTAAAHYIALLMSSANQQSTIDQEVLNILRQWSEKEQFSTFWEFLDSDNIISNKEQKFHLIEQLISSFQCQGLPSQEHLNQVEFIRILKNLPLDWNGKILTKLKVNSGGLLTIISLSNLNLQEVFFQATTSTNGLNSLLEKLPTTTKHLDLSHNNLEHIPIDLIAERCKNLQILGLHQNQLTTIDLQPLENCTQLQGVRLDGNQLNQLDVTPLLILDRLRVVTFSPSVRLRFSSQIVERFFPTWLADHREQWDPY